MGFLDKAKQATEQARAAAARVASERGGQIRSGIDRAGQAVDERTGGKYRDQIARATGAVAQQVDGLAAEHAASTRSPADPVQAEARVVGDQEVAGEGLRPPGAGERTERPGDTVRAGEPPAGVDDPAGSGSRTSPGTAPGGTSPGAPRPAGETPGGPAPGSSR